VNKKLEHIARLPRLFNPKCVSLVKKMALGFLCYSIPYLSAGTSTSDDGLYPVFCHNAAENPALFANFKRAPVYTKILEHVNYEFGASYLQIALRQSPEFRLSLDGVRENDRIGNPVIYKYGEFGCFSPTTLRYLKVASDLKKHFGTIRDMKIVEIGGGYGGQCLVLSKLFSIGSYTIIDLPGPLELTKKYLESHGITNVRYISANDVSKMDPYDLVLSNYAYSECNKKIEDEYLEKVLCSAAKGYLTCNDCDSRTYTKAELMQRLNKVLANIVEFPEEPVTDVGNYIVVWK
jgi:hypothetical protein